MSTTLAKHCVHCMSRMDARANFCGECGAPQEVQQKQQGFAQSFQHAQTFHAPQQQAAPVHAGIQHVVQQKAVTAPSFAQVQKNRAKRPVPKELQEELGKLLCLLARERLFLYMHCVIFLVLNATGIFLSTRAYHGYIGDEITKTIIAMTPLMFINTIALACLSPIKGTKREIARLKEKLSYVRFQIEYHNVF